MSRHYQNKKPFSVSAAAWPALARIGDERKTRVFSQESFLDAREAESLVTAQEIYVFNRISDEQRNGVFTLSDDASNTPVMRLNAPIGWYDVKQPAVLYYSSEGMVPMTRNELVFLTTPQMSASYDIAQRSMTAVGKGRDSPFAAENVFIEKAHKLATSRAASAQVFNDLARTAHYLGMPRAKAFAEQELALGRQLGFSRSNRLGVMPNPGR